MIFDNVINVQSCFDFITKEAPMGLVYYSHFTSIVVSLILGIVVLVYSNKRILGMLLFLLSVVFSLWVTIDLITWTSYNSTYYMFFWSFFGILTALIYIISAYFIYVYIYRRNLSSKILFLLFLLVLPIIIYTPTTYNLSGFSDIDCVSIEQSLFTNYFHLFGVASFIAILIMAIVGYLRTKDKLFRRQITLITIGIEFFIAIFFTATFLDSYLVSIGATGDYILGNYGLFGMTIFMAFLAYLIVKFKAFDIKLLGTQALVWALIILIGSQFFFIQSNTNRILTAITLVISAVVGLMIIRGIKKEVAQREKIEILAKNLNGLNDRLEVTNISLGKANDKLKELDHMKSEFVSLATHQIRGPLSAIKGYISLLVEGDYGTVPQTFNEPLDIIFKSTDSLSRIVTDFLDVSRIDLGQMKYEFTNFDFKELVFEVIKELKPNIEARGLQFREKIVDSPCLIKADRTKLKQVLNNLIDNSNKYTKQGWLEVSVERSENDMGGGGKKVLFAVKDSGVGISKATMGELFQRFSRAKNANDTNILGTGLGLYIAKKMVEANNGKVWAESEGEGKGAQFYVELNLVE